VPGISSSPFVTRRTRLLPQSIFAAPKLNARLETESQVIKTETILLVEDSKFLRIATERILTKAGYRVICAGDGDEALVLAGSSVPDLIVLDMLLPKLSGPESASVFEKEQSNSSHPCGSSFQFVPEQRTKTGAGRC
jgi:PleD family two-component response regulator